MANKKEAGPLSSNKVVIGAFICLLAYVLLYFMYLARSQIAAFVEPIAKLYPGILSILYIFTIPSLLESPMFAAMPFFAFFAIFFLIDWANKHFETKQALSPLFPVIFLLLSVAAYNVALYWYIKNAADLQEVELILTDIDWWGKLTNSAFMLFIWGGIFGWIARFAVEKIKV